MSKVDSDVPFQVTKKNWLLNNGEVFPKITFGVTHIDGFDNIYNAVNCALEYGYRAFDCTPRNNVEEYLGRALTELLPLYNLKRQDIILSTKILPEYYGLEKTEDAFSQSCENLKTDYIDLFLMQWPGGHDMSPESESNKRLRTETWNEIVRLNTKGVIKSPGVCHFTSNHLVSILNCNNQIPTVNQVEFHPRCPQIELLNYCQENDIQLQAASFKETFNPLLLNEPTVLNVAESLNKTPTQVLLKWIINRGVGVIPQSQKPRKIEQNFKISDVILDDSDMDAIAAIDLREKYTPNPIIYL